ncbi:hypothetical protein PV08_09359 [Exophiala spinifera]|uniref:ABM domain-containing protein n=1 Tax=Exophiala spinifera TaxID=91928 RepID=A0A0D2B071_9EURO|nr:uncharacterized protein PV08_09359 [Exophiala spinifera]KIW12085.1 hypothetical protein PV08_09359 [Exophiala spinifera]
MTIIELARISLKNGVTATDATLKQNLKEVKRVIEEYSKLTTLFYTQIDDATSMFVIGAWETKDQHQRGFDGSAQQGEILKLVEDQMDIDWMHYMDIEQHRIPLDAPVLMVLKAVLARHVHRLAVDNEFAEGTATLGGARYGAVSAWNIPKDHKEHAVRVHFSGWDTTDEAVESVASIIAAGRGDGFVEHTLESMLFLMKRTELD